MQHTELTRLEPGTQQRQEIDPRIAYLARLMDDAFTIPGTNITIGLDALIGLVPVVGDLASLVIGGLMMQEAKRLGVSSWTKTRMYWNLGVDAVVGMIPFVGDAFDIGFRAHRRNLRLLQQHLEQTR